MYVRTIFLVTHIICHIFLIMIEYILFRIQDGSFMNILRFMTDEDILRNYELLYFLSSVFIGKLSAVGP